MVSHFALSLSLCVCVCVCVCDTDCQQQAGLAAWVPFQDSASAVTQLYKGIIQCTCGYTVLGLQEKRYALISNSFVQEYQLHKPCWLCLVLHPHNDQPCVMP